MADPTMFATATVRHLDPPGGYTAYQPRDGSPYQVLTFGERDLVVFLQTADQCRRLREVLTEATHRQETAEAAQNRQPPHES